jgi:hypothetical protein
VSWITEGQRSIGHCPAGELEDLHHARFVVLSSGEAHDPQADTQDPEFQFEKTTTNLQAKETVMMKTSMGCLLALLSLVSVAASQTVNTEKDVGALEQPWLQGQKTNNPDLVAPLLADKIVVTEADGKVSDKAGRLRFTKAPSGTARTTTMSR